MLNNTNYSSQLNALQREYPRLHNLRFSPDFEQQFQKNRLDSFLEMDHYLLLVGALVYLSFIITDMIVLPPETVFFVSLGRVIISLIMFVLYYLVKHVQHGWFRLHIFETVAFLLFLVCAHVAISSYFLPEPYHILFMLGIVQVYIVAPALLKPNSRLCSITLLCMLILSTATMFLTDRPPLNTNNAEINAIFNQFPLTYSIFLAGIVVVSSYLTYTFEKVLRKNWLDNQVTELKSSHLEVVSSQLLTLSHEDPLTELSNRRHFQTSLTTELQRARRSEEPLSLLMLDIDNFKAFNDTYGHQAGDRCLKKIADCLKQQNSRSTDLAARYGGEEFVIMLPNTDDSGARFIANNIRSAIEKLRITHDASSFGVVTASIGVTTLESGDSASIDTLIHRADHALYDAKHNGKNAVSVF